MKYFLKCLLAGLMLLVPLSHAGVSVSSGFPDLGNIVSSVDMGVLMFVVSNVDIAGLIWATLKYAALFFIISLAVLFCCGKYHCFKRQNPIWDKCAYLYYLYIPIVFVAFGAVYGASSNAEQQASSFIKNELSPVVNQFLIGTLRATPPEFYDLLANTTPEDAMLILRKMIRDSLDNVFNSGESDGMKAFWQKLPNIGTTFVVDVCANIIYGKVADIAGVSRGDVKRGAKSIYKESFLDLMTKGGDLFGNYAALKVSKMIAMYRFFAMLVLALTLFVPMADFLIARFLKKRRTRNEAFLAGAENIPEGPASS
ncbi:MAG: hypothetical protein LBE06_06240 [Azoarcus sp.]|jgi:hypothetical protein|nr:hypothetical protein [Azoarcus sp.]